MVDRMNQGRIGPRSSKTRTICFLGRRYLPSRQCGGCYSRVVARHGLSDANANGMHLTDDRPRFADSGCFHHEHGTKDEREESCQEEYKDREAK